MSSTDTRMMGVVHDALRRDLTRTAAAVSARVPPAPAQRTALARHMRWMMEFLHRHHAGEDEGLWPLVRHLNPSAGELLDQMSADHAVISKRIDRMGTATENYERDGSDDGRVAFTAALEQLRAALDPHLVREEQEMMPIVATTLSQTQWENFNQEHYVKPKSMSELGMEGHWLIDDADAESYQVVVGHVPPIQRLVLLRGFARRYRRQCTARWGRDLPVGPKTGTRMGAGTNAAS